MSLPDVFGSLLPRHLEYLVALVLQSPHRRHHCYRGDPTVFTLSSEQMFRVLGPRYREVRDLLFECVDSRSSADAGITRAYRLRPLAKTLAERWLHSLPGPRPPAADEKDVRTYVVRLDELQAYARLTGCLFTRVLITKIEPIGNGLGVLYERYRRLTRSGRRFVVGIGLQHAPREVRRRALVGLGYFDVDIVNAHPEILNQLVRGRFPALVQYCSSRESVLHSIAAHYGCTRSDAKRLVLMLTYGAALAGPAVAQWLECADNRAHLPWVLRYARTIQVAGAEVRAAHPKTCDCPRRQLALILQSYEDEVLQACERYHALLGEELSVFMFDGYLIRGRVDVEELSGYVFAETGLDLRFTCEPIGDTREALPVHPLAPDAKTHLMGHLPKHPFSLSPRPGEL